MSNIIQEHSENTQQTFCPLPEEEFITIAKNVFIFAFYNYLLSKLFKTSLAHLWGAVSEPKSNMINLCGLTMMHILITENNNRHA